MFRQNFSVCCLLFNLFYGISFLIAIHFVVRFGIIFGYKIFIFAWTFIMFWKQFIKHTFSIKLSFSIRQLHYKKQMMEWYHLIQFSFFLFLFLSFLSSLRRNDEEEMLLKMANIDFFLYRAFVAFTNFIH